MNILVSSNKNYLKPLIVMLYSLSLFTNEEEIDVYFINVSVSKEDIELLQEKLSHIRKIKLEVLNVNIKELSELKTKMHFSIETYARLLLLKLLPKNIDKILWLDADIIIHNRIDELYNYDVEGHSAVVCKSINQNDYEARKIIGIDDKQLYFNAGVILFNLEYMRAHFDDNQLINYAIENNGKLKWLDQDVLNAEIGDSSVIIDYKKYNYMHFDRTNFSRLDKEYSITINGFK